MERLIPLEHADDPEVAGDKAAGLARARSAGLPVLPGWVIPTGEAENARLVGIEALERSGPPAACLAVVDAELAPAVRRDLSEVGDALGGPAVVRSSTNRDADPRWSGAFATYHDVGYPDLASAVRGCWASAFTRDVTARRELLGVLPGDVRVAVLLQPWVSFDAGGTAALNRGGGSVVTVAAGGPTALVGGRHRGVVVEVSPTGEALSGDAPGVLPSVLGLLREVSRLTGDAGIEWGSVGTDVFLLQAGGQGLPAASVAAAPLRPGPPPSVLEERLARLANRYPAPLGEAFVLSWAAGIGRVPDALPIRVADPSAALAELAGITGRLMGEAWGRPTPAVIGEASAAFRDVLGSERDRGLERLAGLRPVDPAATARALALAAGLGDELVSSGRLPHRDHIWRVSREELEAAFGSGRQPPVRLGPDRWEPFVYEVVAAAGRNQTGTAAAPGSGAGRLLVVAGPADLGHAPPRQVLALADPVPQAAPMLWGCAGVVTAGGSPAAHLFEVARSLGVPAVAGVDLTGARPRALVSVDGNAGRVSVLPAADRPEAIA
jgi:phosphohistidine swiveling domain-containing protein